MSLLTQMIFGGDLLSLEKKAISPSRGVLLLARELTFFHQGVGFRHGIGAGKETGSGTWTPAAPGNRAEEIARRWKRGLKAVVFVPGRAGWIEGPGPAGAEKPIGSG